MHLTPALIGFLCTHGCVPHAQFPIWLHTFVADVLRVVHDWFLSRWSRALAAWLVVWHHREHIIFFPKRKYRLVKCFNVESVDSQDCRVQGSRYRVHGAW